MTRMSEALSGRWVVPGTCLGVGLGLAALFVARDAPGTAIWTLAIMVGYGAILLALSGRSEVVALLRGQTDDERRALIHLRASSGVAHVLITVLVVGFVVQLIRGADPSPWGQLAAVAGLTYLAGLIIAIRRG